MTRASAGALVVIALAAGLALRLARLDVRPMHHDEANQAVKFGALLERGEYRYDATDHHGPTLYYLTLPAAWLRGQATLAALDERTLRGLTAAFGAATLLLLPLLAAGIGRAAVAAAALLLALSPAMVFYSRMYIQESLFVCFTLAFLIASCRIVIGGGRAWYLAAGLAAGLTIATKETSAIVLPAAALACAAAWWSLGAGRDAIGRPGRAALRDVALAAAVAVAVAALFFSSFFTNPRGIVEPLLGATTYVDRGVAPARHAHEWHYYLRLLGWSSSGGLRWTEGLVLLLAALGITVSWRPGGDTPVEVVFCRRALATYAVVTTLVFSAIPYKTPWNLLPFHVGLVLAAGVGAAWLVDVVSPRPLRALLVAVLGAAAVHLGWQAWRASVTYAADPRNPYVYAQTVPDAVRMAARVRDLAARHPDGARMQVSVVAPPDEQWPLPWYLRAMPNVGYWTAPGDPTAMRAPVIVSAVEHTAAIDEALGDRYVAEFYGLRPEVPLALYVERGLWDRFLADVAGPAGSAP